MPLPIPSNVWEDISMDFITDLPKAKGKSVIMVVVDRLSKYAHFSSLPPNFNASVVAELFIKDIVKLHGIPSSIVSDRDRVFTSRFWKELNKLSGTKLNFSSAYHPQSDGQTEVVNRVLEMYLRSYCHDNPSQWLKLLPWAELWYNSSFHSSLGLTPFKVLYGKEASEIPHYKEGESSAQAVDEILHLREETLEKIKKNLSMAQNRIKNKDDRKRSDIIYEEGDWVLVQLKPYRQESVAQRLHNKLCKRYFGPYEISKKINEVAYRLKLPDGSKIHPTFPVSRLRKFCGIVTEQNSNK